MALKRIKIILVLLFAFAITAILFFQPASAKKNNANTNVNNGSESVPYPPDSAIKDWHESE